MFSPSSDSFPTGNRALLTNLLQPILTAAIQATDAARGNIQLLDADRAILRIVVHQGFDEPFLSYFSSVHEDRFGCGTAMKRRKRTVVKDVQESPLFTEEARQVMIAARALACQSTPLITSDGKMVGMMSTHFSEPHLPTTRQLKRVDTLAERAAALIGRIRHEEVLSVDIRKLIDQLREDSEKTRIVRSKP